MSPWKNLAVFIALITLAAVDPLCAQDSTQVVVPEEDPTEITIEAEAPDSTTVAIEQVVAAAREQVGQTIYYDPAYERLDYPGGDVPMERGVCTDVVVRAFRRADVDLQKLIHEDMKTAFSAYPQQWGLSRPDANIDHRRVPNMMTFFERQQKDLPISDDPDDYLPGDVVAWRLPGGRLHVGVVATEKAPGTNRSLLVHNIGSGAQLEDLLFAFEIIGHYRYF